MTTNFFSPMSFIAVFGSGSGIRDRGSEMGKNQDPGSGINIPDPPHWLHLCMSVYESFVLHLCLCVYQSFVLHLDVSAYKSPRGAQFTQHF
jgi:hypothetical protein